jgi:hypothetical protein
MDEARASAAANALSLGGRDLAQYDLDEIETWTLAAECGTPDIDRIVNAWNLLTDVSKSVGHELAAARLVDRATSPAYDRLFRSCDLPAMETTPVVGELSEEDRRMIAAALRHGLSCFDAAIAPPRLP